MKILKNKPNPHMAVKLIGFGRIIE